MERQLHSTLLVLAVVFINSLICEGHPISIEEGSVSIGGEGGISIIGNQKGIGVSTSTISENGKCLQEITIDGKGFTDTLKMPCSDKGFNIISTEEETIMGGSSSPFTIYSYEPSSVVLIDNGKCTKKVYTTTGDKTTSEETPLSDEECEAIGKKIVKAEEENKKYWEEWEQNFAQQTAAAFPPCFPFCNQPSSSYGNNNYYNNNKYNNNNTNKSGENNKNNNKKNKSPFPPCFPFCDNDYDY